MNNFYHIYALGFCGAEKINLEVGKIEHRLQRVKDYLPQLKALGTQQLLIGPVFEAESHGYDTIDYGLVDRRLGDEQDLKELVEACHQEGIQVMLDCVFNHASRSHFAFKDILEKGENSAYRYWFKGIDFSRRSPRGDAFTYETWDGHDHLVKWDLKNEAVKDYLIEIALGWIATYDIDGLRMDAADVMDLNFLKGLSRACRDKKSGFFMLGEIVGGDYGRLVREGELDAVTNYECYKGLYSSLNDINYFEIAYALNRQFGPMGCMRDIGLYNFVDNHDVNRVASELKKETHLYPLYVLLYTMPGMPSIYYLSEFGKKGKRTSSSDEALRTAYIPEDCDVVNPVFQCICKLAQIRKDLKALMKGDYQEIFVSAEQLVFCRTYEDEKLLIALNASEIPVTINIPIVGSGRYWDVLNQEQVLINGSMQMPSNWGRILKLI